LNNNNKNSEILVAISNYNNNLGELTTLYNNINKNFFEIVERNFIELINTLSLLHKEQIFHVNISLDNLVFMKDTHLYLSERILHNKKSKMLRALNSYENVLIIAKKYVVICIMCFGLGKDLISE